MSMKNRRFSLDSSSLEGTGLLTMRRGSMRFSSKKSVRSQSIDADEVEAQQLNHSLSSKMSLREHTIAEESLERSDGLITSQSFLKHNKTFHKLFEEIPEEESMTHAFTCALQKEVLYHGKLFISENHVCFYSSVLLKDTKVVIPASSMKGVKKHNSALSMLSIQTSRGEKYSFVSLRNRETCYKLLQSFCSPTQEGSVNSSPHLSAAENEAEHDLVSVQLRSLRGIKQHNGTMSDNSQPPCPGLQLSSYSSLEDNVDPDLSGSYHENLRQMSSEVPSGHRCARRSSSTEDQHKDVPRTGKATERAMQLSLFTEIGNLGIIFYIFMTLVLLLVLASGYIGLKITALEEQLNSLGALTEWSSN
ncbi:GRAM domain-containing protein 2A-like isoform X1 [Leuresthes tenuis]|uniref:GRAM domain-containing protein 2A-like isoform X1 n=1 Tax=Leuresthes tenuis TaxID=355514 RepID=UPI003B5012FA